MSDVARTPVEEAPATEEPKVEPQEGGITAMLDGGEDSKTGLPPWQEQLPQELKGNQAFDGIKDIPDLARRIVNGTEPVEASGDAIRIPTQDSTSEENNAFWKRLGRPDTPGEYDLAEGDMATGFQADDRAINKVKELLFKAGVSNDGFKDFIRGWTADYMDIVKMKQSEHQEQRQEGLTTLREREWRGQYDQNVNLAKKGWQWLIDDSLKDKVVASGISEDPAWLKAMYRLGKQLGEDTILTGRRVPPAPEAPKEYPNSPEMYRDGNRTIYPVGQGVQQRATQPVKRFAGTTNSPQGVEARNPNAGRTPSGRRPR